MWVVGARRAGGRRPSPIPRGNFAFPLEGTYRGDQVMLNASEVNLQFSFGPVPLRSLDFRGRLGADGRFGAGASLYGQVTCAEVPNYSFYLYVAGVCNPSDTLAASGTFLSDRYRGGPANRRPAGLSVSRLSLDAADAPATAARPPRPCGSPRGARYPAARHLGSILLVDAGTGKPVSLDYRDPDHQREGPERQPPPGEAGDPGRDRAAGPGPRLRDRRRLPARLAGVLGGCPLRAAIPGGRRTRARAAPASPAGRRRSRSASRRSRSPGGRGRRSPAGCGRWRRRRRGRGRGARAPGRSPRSSRSRRRGSRRSAPRRPARSRCRPTARARSSNSRRSPAKYCSSCAAASASGASSSTQPLRRAWRPGSCTALSASPSPTRRSSPSGVSIVVV